MRGHSLVGSAVIMLAAKSSSIFVAGLTADVAADPQNIITQGGIFAVAIAIGYFMLRRGDTREKEDRVATALQLKQVADQAQADLRAMRDEMSILRAELLTTRDKLVETLIRNADHAREMTNMTTELERYRNDPGRRG